ncbi:serine protease 41-like [Drosophila mauritiana]|uniref:Serine protease 41-like n=1 Tax=Drosophila mauritiana TaxID=7226 RepID=A0A6P8KCK2_DROMA|nr:serine protease 41-like [Drosophila mauritiana]
MSGALRFAVFALLLFYQGSALLLEQNCGKCSVFSPTPWLVKIRTELSSNITCTGTLINERFVLTAASCIDYQAELIVRLGEIDGTLKNSSKLQYEEIYVARAIVHRSYSSESYQHNIALLRLKTSVVYKRNIQPICIDVNVGKVPKAPTFEMEMKKNEVPKKYKVGILNRFLLWLGMRDPEPDVILTPQPFEIGWPLTTQIDKSTVFHQYGILSHHNSKSKKDVYTDVMAYADWIMPLALDVHITMAPNTDFDFKI